MNVTALELATRFLGLSELAGAADHPRIMAMLRLDAQWPQGDETPWCSAFVNEIAWLLGLERSESLRARSWLRCGERVSLERAQPRFDVVVLQRGNGPQPGPDVIEAPGHVGFYVGHDDDEVWLLGGNQGNRVSVATYDTGRILGIRRLQP